MTYRSGEQIYMEAVKHNQGYSAKYRVTKLLGKDGCLFLAVNFVLCFWMLLNEKLLSSLKCTTGVLLLYSIRNKCGCHYIMQRPRANCIFPTNKPLCVCVCVSEPYICYSSVPQDYLKHRRATLLCWMTFASLPWSWLICHWKRTKILPYLLKISIFAGFDFRNWNGFFRRERRCLGVMQHMWDYAWMTPMEAEALDRKFSAWTVITN